MPILLFIEYSLHHFFDALGKGHTVLSILVFHSDLGTKGQIFLIIFLRSFIMNNAVASVHYVHSPAERRRLPPRWTIPASLTTEGRSVQCRPTRCFFIKKIKKMHKEIFWEQRGKLFFDALGFCHLGTKGQTFF